MVRVVCTANRSRVGFQSSCLPSDRNRTGGLIDLFDDPVLGMALVLSPLGDFSAQIASGLPSDRRTLHSIERPPDDETRIRLELESGGTCVIPSIE